jgi:RNA polymerase sigma-70 factor (ECF subfamily)
MSARDFADQEVSPAGELAAKPVSPARDFAGIYEQQVAQVYGFFGYLVRSRDDAEDLTQQTFERALRAWGRFDSTRGSASAWLLAIARNLFIDHARASRPDRTQSVEQADLEGFGAATDRPSVGLDPELERALDELSARERELIALRFGSDLSGAEIASLTGLTLANVQQILSRSLRRMRQSLEGVGAGAADAGRRAQAG